MFFPVVQLGLLVFGEENVKGQVPLWLRVKGTYYHISRVHTSRVTLLLILTMIPWLR